MDEQYTPNLEAQKRPGLKGVELHKVEYSLHHWNLVMNELLMILEQNGCEAIAYANDIVLLESLDGKTNSKLIQQLQRSACVIIGGALRNTPMSTLEMIFGLFPLDLFRRGMAANISKRL